MEFEKLDPHCEEVANTYDVYGSLKPEPYYDFLSEKMQIPQNYDDLIRFFICKRILPIMCNELNRTKYNSYRMWPMPYMDGADEVVCLANNETILTKDAFEKADSFADNLFHPMCSIPDKLDEIWSVSWPYLVLYKNVQTDNAKHPEYRIIARANYVISSERNYELTFSTTIQDQFQPYIEQFKNECIRLSQEILTDFKNTPVMLGIKKYNGSISNFENEILSDMDQELHKQGFPMYHAYFDNTVYNATIIRVYKKHPDFLDDGFHIMDYSVEESKKKNRFYYAMDNHPELHFHKINVGKLFFDTLDSKNEKQAI